MKRIIILVGESGAGKGDVCAILKSEGFTGLSLSDEVRSYVSEIGIVKPKRSDWREKSTEARAEFGSDYFAQRVISKDEFSAGDRLVIDGVRHPSEVEAIKKAGSSELDIWAIQASAETRYGRIVSRKDATGHLTFEEFVAGEEAEMKSNLEGGQNTQACIDMATLTIWNEANEEDRASLRGMIASGIENNHSRRKEER